MEAALADLPAGIDETYDRMLLSISLENWEQVRRALLILAFSVRPMRIEEVAEFAIISGRSRPFDPGDRLFDPKDIIGLTAGLIVYDETNESLILAHYSVQEYLLSSRITDGPARYFALVELAANQYISQACVFYMLSVADLTIGYHGITQDYPFLQYAAAHWVQHSRHGLCDATSGMLELALQVLDGRNGAYRFWLTYHDAAGRNRTALESLYEYLYGPQVLTILQHPGLLHLPSEVLAPELCVLFTRLGVSNRSPTSVQIIIDAKVEILKIVRGLAHPRSKFSRLKMFRDLCLMDARDVSPNWQPLNEAMYLALFEPLHFPGLENPPEKLSAEEVELEGEELEHEPSTLGARERRDNRFPHTLDYIRKRLSQGPIERETCKAIDSGDSKQNNCV